MLMLDEDSLHLIADALDIIQPFEPEMYAIRNRLQAIFRRAGETQAGVLCIYIPPGEGNVTLRTRADLMTLPAWQGLDTDTAGCPMVWDNFYSCRTCSSEQVDWTSEWSCQCDDDCPDCGNPSPAYDSRWIGPTDWFQRELWEALPEKEDTAFTPIIITVEETEE